MDAAKHTGRGSRVSLGFSRTRPAARAFTLVELIVVMGIISILLGIGAGLYSLLARTSALRGETRAVIAIIQAAQGMATSQGGEAFVCLEPDQGRLYPFARQQVGVWHFESLHDAGTDVLTYGAFGQSGLVTGGTATLTDGEAGKTLKFDGSFHLVCRKFDGAGWVNILTYDARDGVAIEASVAPTGAGYNRLTVLWRDGWYGMWLGYDGPSGRFALEAFAVTKDPVGSGYTRYSAATAPVIRMDEWTHVAMSCHKLGTGVTLTIQGVEQDLDSSGVETGAAAPAAHAVTTLGGTGAGEDRFYGRVDQLILSAYTVGEAHSVSQKLHLDGTGLADGNTVRFEASGQLANVHEGVTPRVLLEERRSEEVTSSVTISVGSMGALNVDTWHK